MDNNMVYKQSFTMAQESGEVELFHKSSQLNQDCASAIDREIAASQYETNYYDTAAAAKKVIAEYGTDRVSWVLAGVLQNHTWDGRYSSANKEWAQEFPVPTDGTRVYLNAHPILVEAFIDNARQQIAELVSTTPEVVAPELDGERVAGFIVRDSILFENDRGFAFAENASRVQSFVTWQFTEDNGHRDYYWGHYYEDKGKALSDFERRVSSYRKDYGLSEKPAPQTEQKPSILARLQEGKRAVAQEKAQPKTAPNHDNNREV